MMNTLLNIYFRLPHDKTLGIFTKVFNRLFAKILKQIFDRTVPNYFLRTQYLFPSGLNTKKRDKQIVLSLTSFPGRIQDVWIVVECLFRQTFKSDKIILWLSESQFKGIELPKLLIDQQKRGLEIRYVQSDLKSHKKYIYALNQFKNDYIITVDDDLYYDNKLIQNLIVLKEKYPNALPTNRAHLIKFESNQKVSIYSKWFHNYATEKESFLLVPTGGFGTMYEYNQMHHTFYDQSLIMELAPCADDLWLKVQTLLKNVQIITNSRYNKDPITIKSSQLEKLVSTNVLNGGNDIQFSAILGHFNLGNLEKFATGNE
jgi:hypothetical protein